jgi:ATP-dependent helicase/DNAse subunit B
MIDEKENKAIVVDYKTGKDTFSQNLVKHGFHLQLPLYATLLKGEYSSLEVSGLFLQSILVDKRELEDKENTNNLYRLAGICTDDLYTFRRMDTLVGNEKDENGKVINDSKFIKGAGLTSKQTSVKGSVKKDVFGELIDTAHKKVIEANESIRNSIFTINPKTASGLSLPCEFCECYDICFKKNSDIVVLKNDSKEDK